MRHLVCAVLILSLFLWGCAPNQAPTYYSSESFAGMPLQEEAAPSYARGQSEKSSSFGEVILSVVGLVALCGVALLLGALVGGSSSAEADTCCHSEQ
ncbi:MAG: hypothetical protein FWG04_05405 [Desulfovibrionaceae bacterium]|nr:hypothetical protein [Desulfovibrionaceae bacterium]